MGLQVRRFKKKPVIIEAVELTEENMEEVARWINENSTRTAYIGKSDFDGRRVLIINTLEGKYQAYPGVDIIVKGTRGEFYPVKRDIFEEIYEPAES